MYMLIVVIGVLSQGASVLPVGVTSQIVGKFKNLDECKAAAKHPTPQVLLRISLSQQRGEPPGIAHTAVRIDPIDGSRPNIRYWYKADTNELPRMSVLH